MRHWIFTFGFLYLCTLATNAQERVGINTAFPQRTLDISGTGTQYMRIQTNLGTNVAGMEFVLGDPGGLADWSILNRADSKMVFSVTDGPLGGASYSPLTIDTDGNFGIGTLSPENRLHINWGNMATNSGLGFLRIGEAGGPSLVFDRQGVLAANGGGASSLYLQTLPAWTYFGRYNPSSTFVVDGNVSIGANLSEARMNINTINWHMYLPNYANTPNGWFIGASNGGWTGFGDDKLLFSASAASESATLALSTASDNNGTDAPVQIRTAQFQSLLIDGNEIDSEGALFINHNNGFNTYFNVNGGRVGIGTTNPQAKLHIKSNVAALAVEQPGLMWQMALQPSGDIGFYNYNGLVSLINWANGGWVALSDSTKKAAIRPLADASAMIEAIELKSYTYKHDKTAKQDIGVIAQELKDVVPQAVFDMDGQYGVAYDQLAALAVKGIQEQQERILELLELARKE